MTDRLKSPIKQAGEVHSVAAVEDVADVLRILVDRHHAQYHKQFPAESCPAWPCDLVRNAVASSPAPASSMPGDAPAAEEDENWQQQARKVLWDWKGLESLSIPQLDELVGRIAVALHARAASPEQLCECTDHDPQVCLNGEVDEGSRYCHCACHAPAEPVQPTGEQTKGVVIMNDIIARLAELPLLVSGSRREIFQQVRELQEQARKIVSRVITKKHASDCEAMCRGEESCDCGAAR